MNHSDFIRRIKQLEAMGAADDQRFQWRIAAWLVLGYAYVGGFAALMILLPSALVIALVMSHHLFTVFMLKGVLFATIGYGWALVKVFKTSRNESEEKRRQLTRTDAPALFALLDTISNRLQAPALTAVYINNERNAGIRQLPRLGFLLGSRNELTLGLPLMQTLSKDQFAAVLAHEFAHLSGSHGKFASRVYAMRQVWENLEQHLQAHRSWANAWLRWFLSWYVPHFNAETFVLGRASEYAADRMSADIIGNATMAHALMASNLTGRWLRDEFWPKIFMNADRHPEPAGNPFTQLTKLYKGIEAHTIPVVPHLAQDMHSWGNATQEASAETAQPMEHASREIHPWQHFLEQPHTRAKATIWLHEELAVPTGYSDTHPCLRDRMKSLGMDTVMPDLPPAGEESAAGFLLGTMEMTLASEMDEHWRQEVAPYWADKHAYLNEGRLARYHDLLRKKATQAFSAQNWFDLACAQIELAYPTAAYHESLQQALTLDPSHAPAHHKLGRLALEDGRLEEAATHFEAALQSDPDFAATYYDLQAQIALRQGHLEASREHLLAHDRFLEKCWALQQEMNEVDANDCFTHHGLSDYQINTVREELSSIQPQISQAWIVKKIPRNDERQAYWIVVLQPRMSVFTRWLGRFHYLHHPYAVACHALLGGISLTLPGYYRYYVAEHPSDGVMRKVPKEGMAIFESRR